LHSKLHFARVSLLLQVRQVKGEGKERQALLDVWTLYIQDQDPWQRQHCRHLVHVVDL